MLTCGMGKAKDLALQSCAPLGATYRVKTTYCRMQQGTPISTQSRFSFRWMWEVAEACRSGRASWVAEKKGYQTFTQFAHSTRKWVFGTLRSTNASAFPNSLPSYKRLTVSVAWCWGGHCRKPLQMAKDSIPKHIHFSVNCILSREHYLALSSSIRHLPCCTFGLPGSIIFVQNI